KDRTEIYYYMLKPHEDQKPADLIAGAVGKHLGLPSVTLPANYYVLRNNPVPAILGEPCFIHLKEHQDEIKSLSFKFREALGYFTGLRTYFDKGIPKISSGLLPGTNLFKYSPGRLSFTVSGAEINRERIHASIDGHDISPGATLSGTVLRVALPPLPNGAHTVTVQVGNRHGNYSKEYYRPFTVDYSPHSIEAASYSSSIVTGQQFLLIRFTIRDVRGVPVTDDTPVTVTSDVPLRAVDSSTRNGQIEAVVDVSHLPPGRKTAIPFLLSTLPRRFETTVFITAAPSYSDSRTIVQGIVTEADGTPLSDVTVSNGSKSSTFTTGRSGHYSLFARKYQPIIFKKPGYVPVLAQRPGTAAVTMIPLCRELIEARITLSARKERSFFFSYINRKIILHLEKLLSRSGARVQVVSKAMVETPYLKKARESNVFQANWFIEIVASMDKRLGAGITAGLDRDEPYCFHYPRSTGGIRFSKTYLKRHFPDEQSINDHHRNSSNYALINTSCPAIVLFPGPPPPGNRLEEELTNWITETSFSLYFSLIKSVNNTFRKEDETTLRQYIEK
ncbi:MAG: hypothetical protein QGH40_00355, partial [bacterium]|nr:hypothetical protein [bacterium]